MDVVYRPPAHYPPGHSGSTVRRTQSTHDEATRILKWNYDVATDSWSAARPPADRHQVGRRPSQQPTDEPYAVFRRSVTTSTIEPSPRRSSTSNGLSNGAVVGTLLGVAAGAAAGAAITYGMIRKDRARAPRQEFDMPTFPRRSTFPVRLPSDHPPDRFVELERTTEKIRYPDDYAPAYDHHAPVGSRSRWASGHVQKSKEFDEYFDDRSRRLSRENSNKSHARSRSETPAERFPLMIKDGGEGNYASPRQSYVARPTPRPILDMDRESYVSARTHRSSSTVRPHPHLSNPARADLVVRSKAGSKVTTIKVSGNTPMSFPPNASRTHSLVSARNVALPPSVGSSSDARWDEDADSVAPSDSISCAGSRRHGRSYH